MTYTTSVSNGLYSADAVEPLGIPTVARQLAATTTSANTTLTANISRISIRARFADIRYVVGVGAQTANASTSHFIANGERLDIAVAVIRESGATVNGSLAVTELN
jgi:hypothetical protein